MNDCVFCKIINGEIPCHKIYEDSKTLAFLDAFPHVKGQSLVISKEHISSNFSEITDDSLSKGIIIAKKVAISLRKALNSPRILEIIEGLDVPHMHIKLFPLPLDFTGGLADLVNKYPRKEEMITTDEGNEVLNEIKKFI